jgi:hypothetical protein
MNITRVYCCLVVATGLILLGCSDEQRRSLGEVDVRETLAGRVEVTIGEEALAINGDLDCSSQIDEDGAVTGSCSGTTTDGAAVTGTLTGTGDVEAGTCVAHLVVAVDGETLLDDPTADCFDVA